jgi:hypothetical protein
MLLDVTCAYFELILEDETSPSALLQFELSEGARYSVVLTTMMGSIGTPMGMLCKLRASCRACRSSSFNTGKAWRFRCSPRR